MAKSTDEGWARFQLELGRQGTRELATALRVEGTVITAWKGGRSRPRFRDLPRISSALFEGNSTRLAQLMGMVPDEEIILERLTREYIESRRLGELVERRRELLRSTPAESAASIVAAATRTGRWAVAVWPAFEGPSGCKLHVSDRLDFRRTDGGEASAASLREDLGEYLDEFNAVRNAALPRYDPPSRSGAHQSVEHWSTYRFLADRPPTRDVTESDVTSIAVVASSVYAWTTDTAAILSRILGFGLVSTRSLAAQARQGPRADDEALKLRLRFHSRLLADPPHHSIWHHFGHLYGDVSKFLPDTTRAPWPRGLVLVRLKESEALLRSASKNDDRRAIFDSEHAALTTAIAQLPAEFVVELDVDVPAGPDGSALELVDLRNERLAQSLRLAGTVIRVLRDRELLSAERLDEAVRRDPDPDRRRIVTWLRDEGVLW